MELNENYTTELLKLALRNKRVLECALPHLKDSFLPSDEQSIIWKDIKTGFLATNTIPTIGTIAERHKKDLEVLEEIGRIKESQLPDADEILNQFEGFIKDSMFHQAYDELSDLFNASRKEDAFTLMKRTSEDIANFSIKEKYYTRLYDRFHDRHNIRVKDREEGKFLDEKIPFGIDEMDRITKGGCNKKDVFCANAQSGVGKSKLLRHIGVHASRRGFRGLHVSAEGSEEENMAAFDTAILGQKLGDVERGTLSDDILTKVKSVIRDVRRREGELFIECYEQFDTASLSDVRNLIIEIEKIHGKLDFLSLDYLELFDPGDGKKYSTSQEGERLRRDAVASKLKNIAMEFNIAIFTATQASSVEPELLNDPKFVMTRYNISGNKTLIKPFSYFVTLNQTKDEYNNNVMRIYMDKVRKYKGGQIIKIFQRYDRERFYDRRRTINEISQAA